MQTLPFESPVSCVECGDPVDVLRAAAGRPLCDDLTCLGSAQLRERRQQQEARVEKARMRLAVVGIDPDAASWSPLPANRNGVVPMSEGRRDQFLHNLGEAVAEAQRTDASAPLPEWERGRPVDEVEAQPLLAGCIACRGYCCLAGGTTAFLTPEAIRTIWPFDRDAPSADEIVDTYRRHLPDEHIEEGCVFQGAEGCVLPRDLRSPTCNHFLCLDIGVARKAWLDSEAVGAPHHFVAIQPGDPDVAAVATTRIPPVVSR